MEEGSICPIHGCDGVMQFPPVENCSCHINAPCSACTDNQLTCNVCAYVEESEDTYVPPTEEQQKQWAAERAEYQRRFEEGYVWQSGVRVYRVTHDGSSGSTHVIRGCYDGTLTAAEIIEHFGDGTFGHRGPHITADTFEYIKVTD